MSLAHAFGKTAAKESASRQLKPGVVIKMLQKMDDGKVQEKWFVVVQVNASTVTCVINTKVPRLFQHKPHLLMTQIAVTEAEHPFMDHLSHLDCSKVMCFPTVNVIDQLTAKPEWIKGTASDTLLSGMVSALSSTPLLTKTESVAYCAAIAAAIGTNGTVAVASMPTSADSASASPSGTSQPTTSQAAAPGAAAS